MGGTSGHPIRKPRKRWLINPRTRIHDSQKRYSRRRQKADTRRELRETRPPGKP